MAGHALQYVRRLLSVALNSAFKYYKHIPAVCLYAHRAAEQQI